MAERPFFQKTAENKTRLLYSSGVLKGPEIFANKLVGGACLKIHPPTLDLEFGRDFRLPAASCCLLTKKE